MSSWRLRAFSVTALFAVGLAGVAGGCGLVVGAGDYVIGDAGSSARDATSVDTATEPANDSGHEVVAPLDGPGLADGFTREGGSPEAGTPETGPGEGGGGDANLPLLGCTPDGGPIPQAFPSGSDALQQLVRACVIAESCEPEYFDVSLAECITNDYFDAFPSFACLATAKTCQDFYNCRGYRIADTTDCPSSLDTDFGKCVNGTVATNCPFTGVSIVSNCAAVGGTCTAFDEDDAGDTAAGCKILSSCPDTAAVDQCAGTTQLYSCAPSETGTVALGLNCPQSSTCRANGDGAHCFANGPSCTTPSAACADGNLNSCLATPSGNQARTYKCSTAGLLCITDADGGKGSCVAPGCEHSHCVDSCDDDGETLHTCIGGAQYDIDCVTALGFSGCGTITPPGSSTEYAYCY